MGRAFAFFPGAHLVHDQTNHRNRGQGPLLQVLVYTTDWNFLHMLIFNPLQGMQSRNPFIVGVLTMPFSSELLIFNYFGGRFKLENMSILTYSFTS